MKTRLAIFVQVLFAVIPATTALAATPIQLAQSPALSPDGSTLAFAYDGDVWTVPIAGGAARRLTFHPADDGRPHFSPDGKQLAFVSDREAGSQVFVMSSEGGAPRQVTHHTEGYDIEDWYPDGKTLLLSGMRDGHWRHARRFFPVGLEQRSAEQPLFDAYGSDASLSPDGRRLLFVREGERWWRKGYRGSRAGQIWMCSLKSNNFTELLKLPTDCFWPKWKADGRGFYYVGAESGSFNLWEYDLKSKKSTQLTHFEDDSVVNPTVSRDGSTIVFRHLFDLYVLRPGDGQPPRKLELIDDSDQNREEVLRRTLTKASQITYTEDALEMAFIAGGDLWVMDTVLKEPRQVTDTADEEQDPTFTADGKAILLVGNREGQADLWKVQRADDELYWWQNESFTLTQLTDDAEVESRLKLSPDGKQMAYVRGNGDLWVADLDGKNARRVIEGFDPPDYDFSPDGKWLVYSQSNDNFNSDIWLAPLDGSREPFNVSRHPDNESGPVWSPDGRAIAFVGRRMAEEVDIYYVWLKAEDEDRSSRERRLEQALEKIQKARKTAASGKTDSSGEKKDENKKEEDKKEEDADAMQIDFDRMHERIHRISVPNSSESDLFWSPDSKKLVCTATVDGKRGTYTFAFPDSLKPTLLSTTVMNGARWLKKTNTIVGLADGAPSVLSATGAKTSYTFRAAQEVEQAARYRAAFDLCWRTMRDWWYDPRLGNRNWDAVRRKYREAAGSAVDARTFSTVVHLMLGELNGSHLGFSMRTASTSSAEWSETTAHLGVRFDANYKGPGLKVRDVLPGGPAEKVQSRLAAGDIVLSIDGVQVDPDMDLTEVLNGRLDRDIHLHVKESIKQEGEKDKSEKQEEGDDTAGEREVAIRPISYASARGLLYRKWIDDNHRHVEKASAGKLGYLHIQSMNEASFLEFERALYTVGYGKDGLVIDVRENGGGYTTDHLLTALTQPRHAITKPRGGGRGYPQDRTVYATWHKPIVVLCNQNSFSNAEIFSHAVKTLERGKLVGVPTAGGVISTGAASIMDIGLLRRPFRGWFVLGDGQDMELNGAVPHVVVWPHPGDLPAGKDVQLDKALQLLEKDIKSWRAQPQVELKYASERETAKTE
ncbi:MAG: S41 family peptidase [Pirellulaceae bacterium]